MVSTKIVEKADVLCDTCVFGQVMRDRDSRKHVHCGNMGEFVHVAVERCSDYRKRGDTSLDDLRRQAWLLRTSGDKIVGFVAPGTAEHKALRKRLEEE